MDRKKVGSWRRGLGVLLLGGMLCAPLTLLFADNTESRGPSGCPPGVSPSEFVCYTLEEEAARQIKEANLESELAVARAKKPRRFGNLWSSVGVGFYPNDKAYQPFAYGGASLGRVYFYGGFSGSDPSVGIGWTF